MLEMIQENQIVFIAGAAALLALVVVFLLLRFFLKRKSKKAGNKKGSVKSGEDLTVVIFRDDRFDLNESDDLQELIDSLKQYPALLEGLERMGVIDDPEDNTGLIVRLFDGKGDNDVADIGSKLNKLWKERVFLVKELVKFEKQLSYDDESRKLIVEASVAVEAGNNEEYQSLLDRFEEVTGETAETSYLKAIHYYTQANYTDALEEIKQVVEDNPQKPKYHFRLGIYADELEDYSLAETSYQAALEYWETDKTKKKFTVLIYNNLGIIHRSRGEYDKAINHFKKALDIKIQALGEKHPSVADTYGNLGIAYGSKGEYDKAINYFEKALDIKIPVMGEKHSDVAKTYSNLGIVYRSKDEYDKAIDYYKKALDIKIPALGEQHSSVAQTYHNLGIVYQFKGEYDDSIEYYEMAIEIFSKVFPEEHPHLEKAKRNLQKTKQAQGKES